jgi:glycogen(starch) synthase
MNHGTRPAFTERRRKGERRTSAAPGLEAVPLAGEGPSVFEVSWEVCSQSGGIYTVLRSKAPSAVRKWGESYWAVGPYREQAAKIEFEPHRFSGPVADAVHDIQDRGVVVHTGRWLITGRPRVLLLDVNSVAGKLDEMKYFLWKDHGISVYGRDPEVDPIVAFGYAIADLLQTVHRHMNGRPMLGHFHEWQGGLALPVLKRREARFPTVFTTHATLVGRSLSAANIDLYDNLPSFDAQKVAEEHGILPRHLIEKACAQTADVFTTVSDITAHEGQHFLGRFPDLLVPNGLNVERFAAPHEFQVMHREAKEHIHEFVMGHFFPSYTFDLDKTLYFFAAGRYEYRNKGFDVFIDALYELNRRLKAEPTGMTVIAFIITRAAYRALNVQVLNRQAMFHELHQNCNRITTDMGRTLFHTVAAGRLPTLDDLLEESARVRLKRMIHAWTQDRQPMIVTHDLEDDLHDPILMHLRKRQLLNAPDDPVKVVFHPDFITSTSPILGLEYDQFVRGCNLGVFPSYYEPWGYTPMECIVRGVPAAITSDLSGFGSYLMDHYPDHDAHGMFVARRRRVSYETTTYQVAGWLHGICKMPLRERISMRNRVESYAEMFDWNRMSTHYRAARRMAFEKHFPGQNVVPEDEPS